MKFRRLGYFGGTFDPPHLGHEMLAMEAYYQLNLDAVFWLLTPDPPHKAERKITPVDARAAMVRLVTNRYEEFHLSELDLKRSPPYYAADTVEIIKEEQPDLDLVYIIGEDSLHDLPVWHDPERFLTAIDQLAVAPRPGFNSDLASISKILPGIEKKTVFLSGIMVEISSSLIRERIGQGYHCKHFLDESVAAYIMNTHLYPD